MPFSSATSTLKKQLAGPLRSLVHPTHPTTIRSAPGRVDVLGGLAVEAGGTLAQMAVPRRAAVFAQRRDDGLLILHSCDIAAPVGEPEVRLRVSELLGDPANTPIQTVAARDVATRLCGPTEWAAPLAALWCLLQQLPDVPEKGAGLTLVIHSEIPMGAGQASSTAVVVAALQAIRELLGFPLDMLDAALMIHRAESLLPASSGHVVDAMACLAADAPAPPLSGPVSEKSGGIRVLRFSAQPHTLVSQTPLPGELRVMALDTGVRYTAVGSTVAAIRLAGAMGLRIIETIYRDLGQRHTPLHGYLANLSPSLYRQYFRALMPKRLRGADFVRAYGAVPERAGPVDPKKLYRVRAAVDHLVTENEFAEHFLQTIEELADPAASRQMTRKERTLSQRRAGRLLLASHHSYSLRLELSCREADWLVDHLMESGPDCGVMGARITGSGGGGTVVALLNRSSAASDALLDTMNAYQKTTGVQLSVCEAGTSGASKR